jgi:hypothetical protein
VLTTSELAARWRMSARTLANWRVMGKGPLWEKKGWIVLYEISSVLRYEQKHPHLLQQKSPPRD